MFTSSVASCTVRKWNKLLPVCARRILYAVTSTLRLGLKNYQAEEQLLVLCVQQQPHVLDNICPLVPPTYPVRDLPLLVLFSDSWLVCYRMYVLGATTSSLHSMLAECSMLLTTFDTIKGGDVAEVVMCDENRIRIT